jgi:phage FluMu protein Com
MKNVVVAPWFLAELKATVEVIGRWHNEPVWKDIEPCLVNPTHFTHTIAKLWIAEHLKSASHAVKIVPKGADASPDLTVQAIGGSQDWINIECYQPSILNGSEKVATKHIENIIKKAMKKAKIQLGRTTPGILAICGFNQPQEVVKHLKRVTIARLCKTDRLNLCGILLVMLGILMKRNEKGLSFTPTISVDFIPNPSYFGRVEIISATSINEPNLVKEPLIDIGTEIPSHRPTLYSSDFTKKETIEQDVEPLIGDVKEEKLRVIETPAKNSCVVFYSQATAPLFTGQGNINYLCGVCGMKLVERAWKKSFSSIVIKCPSCQSYNEFPVIEEIGIQVLGTLAFKKGEYLLKEAVRLRRGACLIGL